MDPTERFVLSLLGPVPERSGGVDWERAAELLRLHRLGPLAVAEDRAAGGELLPEELREELEPQYRATGLTNTLLREVAGEARSALREAGIPSVVYKGMALVESGAYPDPGARTMDDVDLLVPRERVEDAVRALREAGFRPWEEWDSRKPDWVDAAAFSAGDAPDGVPLAIDLHWRTAYDALRFGGGDAGRSILWEDAAVESGLPAPEPHLVVVAEHVLKHVRYLVHFPGLADVARIAGRVEEWDRVAELAAARSSAPGIGIVLGMVAEGCGGPVPASLVRRLRPTTPSTRAARRLLEPARLLGRIQPIPGRAGGVVLRVLLAGSVPAGLRELVEAAFPEPRWLRARYGGEASDGGSPGTGSGSSRPVWRLRLRYLADALRWIVYRGRSPASPNQGFFDPGARR